LAIIVVFCKYLQDSQPCSSNKSIACDEYRNHNLVIKIKNLIQKTINKTILDNIKIPWYNFEQRNPTPLNFGTFSHFRSTCGFQIQKRSFLCKEHGSGKEAEELFEQDSLTFIFPLFGSGSLKNQIVCCLHRRKEQTLTLLCNAVSSLQFQTAVVVSELEYCVLILK
jgi:hypothetical protein